MDFARLMQSDQRYPKGNCAMSQNALLPPSMCRECGSCVGCAVARQIKAELCRLGSEAYKKSLMLRALVVGSAAFVVRDSVVWTHFEHLAPGRITAQQRLDPRSRLALLRGVRRLEGADLRFVLPDGPVYYAAAVDPMGDGALVSFTEVTAATYSPALREDASVAPILPLIRRTPWPSRGNRPRGPARSPGAECRTPPRASTEEQ